MSFNRSDYAKIFHLGRELYKENPGNTQARTIAVELMVMAESVIGQSGSWPNIHKRYRNLIPINNLEFWGSKPKDSSK